MLFTWRERSVILRKSAGESALVCMRVCARAIYLFRDEGGVIVHWLASVAVRYALPPPGLFCSDGFDSRFERYFTLSIVQTTMSVRPRGLALALFAGGALLGV